MRALTLTLLLVLGACTGEMQPPLVATDVIVTAPMPGNGMSAAYLSLTNNTAGPIRITTVTSPDYGSVEIHESSLESGVSKMRRIDILEIPAQSSATLTRGGKHLMLMRSQTDDAEVSLHFYNGDTLLLTVVAEIQQREN